jgi:hypothetical protein
MPKQAGLGATGDGMHSEYLTCHGTTMAPPLVVWGVYESEIKTENRMLICDI